MRHLNQILIVTLKDLKIFAADRGALFFFLVFPFLFVVFFNFMNFGSQDRRLELHLVTLESEGGLSRQIIEAIETKDTLKLKPGEPKIIWDKDYEEVLKAVEEKKIAGFLVFPEDFTEAIYMGYGAELEVMTDPEAINTRAALTGMAQAISSRVSAQRVAMNATIALLIEKGLNTSGEVDNIGKTVEKMFANQSDTTFQRSYIEFVNEKIGDIKATNPSNWLIPGYLVMFVFFLAALSSETIIRERKNQTLERLLASSVRRETILFGTYTGIVAKGFIQIIIFWLAGIVIFKVGFGSSPAGVIILSLLMVIMSSAFAVMLATLAKTQRSAGSVSVLASLVLAPLGGCWWPLFITPRWLQFMAKITPHAWATTGFNELMLFGAGFSAVVPEMLALVGFSALFGIIALNRFRTSAN